MKNKILLIAFIIVAIIHFVVLFYFGISSFTTTLLFYFIVYQIFKKLYTFAFQKQSEKLIINTKIFFILLVSLEFYLTFINKQFNNGMENYRYLYFSYYKTEEQYKLLKYFRPNKTIITVKQGHFPNTTDIITNNEFTYKHTYNADGFRDKDLLTKIDSNNYNIVFLGDSFIEGEGAPNDSTLPCLLQNKLIINQKKTVVYNCGISGSNPLYEIQLYKNRIEKYKPNLVLLAVFENDLEDMEIALYNKKNMPIKEYFIAISHIYRIISIASGDNYISLENTSDKNKKVRNKIIKKFILEMHQFESYLAKKNVKLQLIYIPCADEFYRKQLVMFRLNTDMRKKLVLEFPSTINLYDKFQKENITYETTSNIYWRKNGHLNSNGYNLASKILKDNLNNTNLK